MKGATRFKEQAYTVKGVYGVECSYCGKHIPIEEITQDHVVPKSLGGRTNLKNLVPACYNCNQLKGSKLNLNKTI